MKKILIPTDFSDNAAEALSYALGFIGKSPAHLHIVTVVDMTNTSIELTQSGADLFGLKMDTAQKSMEELRLFVDDYLFRNGQTSITITTKVIPGLISDELSREASDFGSDLIIMGTEGVNHGLLDKWLGTVSLNIIDKTKCPVLFIPRGHIFAGITNVIFTTNLNHSEPFELFAAIELLQPNTAIVRCLHVNKPNVTLDNTLIEKFSKYMVEHSPAIQTIFYIEHNEDIDKVIKEFAETYDVEMIIMSKSKKTFLEKLFGTSHTKKMMHMVDKPLLIMK